MAHSSVSGAAEIASCPHVKCPLGRGGMKLSDYDRGHSLRSAGPPLWPRPLGPQLLFTAGKKNWVKGQTSRVAAVSMATLAPLRPGSLAS